MLGINESQSSGNRLVKHSGQVFTPSFLVRNILDFAMYKGAGILGKHVIDNSCGDGAFLVEVADRYCRQYTVSANAGKGQLKEELEKFIHGIELEEEAFVNCLDNLNRVAEKYGVSNVHWDVLRGNALSVSRFDGKMDFVVGNPPYVRVHNLEADYEAVKRYSFAQEGMTDLYLVFYELGLRMLTAGGKLCYITPSSWLTSVAASNMRRYIMLRRTLSGVVDLGHFQAFNGITTYTAISLFETGRNHSGVAYYSYSPEKREIIFERRIPYDEISIGDGFYFAHPEQLSLLRDMRTRRKDKLCSVKNGFATLADKVFLLNVPFDEFTIPVLKASTGKWYKGLFPYDKTTGKPLPRTDIFSSPGVADYLTSHKEELLKGKDERDHPYWYLYGRTQALADVHSDKYAINALVRDKKSIKLTKAPCGTGIYSGLYILTEVPFEKIEEVIVSDDFLDYIRMLRKYKSGGYYTFNSKDLEQYLNAKLSKSLTPHTNTGNFQTP